MEYSSSTQMENQMESGKKEVITKEELNDRYSTVANAGDHMEPSEKATISKGYVKEDISLAEVEIPDCQESAKPDKQERNKPTSSCTDANKEEIIDVLGTMVFPPEMSLSTLYCPSSTPEEFETKNIQEVGRALSSKAYEFMSDALVDVSQPLVTRTVPLVSSSTFTSTSSLKVGNRVPIKRHATIESSPIEMKSIGSTVRNAPACATTSYAANPGTVANERSIRESGSEEHENGCSPGDAGMKETGLSNQHCVENSTNDAKGDCDEGQFPCLDCTAVFNTKAAFKLHIASHEGYRKWKCTVCEQRSTTKQNLMAHMRRHTGEKPFKCDVCEKKFITNGELTVHKHIHTGEKPFKCDVCNQCFTESWSLTMHKRIHTGDKPFECLICQKRFTQSGNLQRHTLVHTGEQPFKCDICDKKFKTSGNLTIHKQIHTEDKLFKCLTCHKRFTQSGNLQRHTLVHTGEQPFKCDICDKKFNTSGNLTHHERIHKGKKPFKCDVCEKCFTQSGSLAIHKLIHTGEKPYKCLSCGLSFRHNCNLKKHKRIHHAGPDADTQPDPDVSHLHYSSQQFDTRRESSPMEDFIIIDEV